MIAMWQIWSNNSLQRTALMLGIELRAVLQLAAYFN
jgi:hypothetical protein